MIRLIRFILPAHSDFTESTHSALTWTLGPLVSFVAILIMLLSTINLVLALVVHDLAFQDLAITIGALSCAALALLLVRRDYVNRSAALIGLLLFILNAWSFYRMGFAPRSISTLPILLVYMSLVYSARGAITALIVSWAMLLGTVFLQSEGYLDAASVPWDNQITDALVVGGLLGVTMLVLNSFEYALRRADRIAAEVRATNDANLRQIEQLSHQLTGQAWREFVVEQRAQSSQLDPPSTTITGSTAADATFDDTEQLYRTGRAVSSATELQIIYQLITDQLCAVPQVDIIDFLLSGPDPALAHYLDSVFSWHRQAPSTGPDSTNDLRISLMGQITNGLLPKITPQVYRDVIADISPNHPLHLYFVKQGIRSAILAPITASGRWFGLLICGSRQPVEYLSALVTFAGAMADQLAIAIDNHRLFDEVQAEARRARALVEAGRLANQMGDDFEYGLETLFQTIADPAGYDRWWFGLLTDDDTMLRRVVASDEWIILPDPFNVRVDKNAAAEAARIGELVLINDPTDHPAISPTTDAVLLQLWGKHLAIPVRVGPKLIGVLQIGRQLDTANLDERDIQLAVALASQIGTATQNQRLFEQTESQRQQLQTIVDSMPTGILVMDRTGQVVLANHALRELLGPDFVTGASNHPEPYPLLSSSSKTAFSPDFWPLSRALAQGTPVTQDDIIIQHPTKGKISVLAQAVPIQNAGGQVASVVATFQDITEQQELEHALQDSLRETMRLYEASRSISRTSSTESLIDSALWQMSALAPDRALFFLKDDAGSITLAGESSTQPSPPAPIGGWLPYLSEEPLLIQHVTTQGSLSHHLDHLGLAMIKSFPMLVRGSVKGWLVIGFATQANISDEQNRFMLTLADQAAITLENHHLLLSTDRALQDTAMLYRASRSIADAQDPSAMLLAFARLTPASQTNLAALYLLHDNRAGTESVIIQLAATWGSNPNLDPLDTHYTAEQFAFWPEINAATLRYIPAVEADTELSPRARDTLIRLGSSAVIFIPLQVAERLIGMIMIGLNHPIALTENDLQVYESLADQAAVSLENTQMYKQTQRRARKLTTSVEISRSVTSILEMDTLLPQIVTLIKNSFEYDHAQIFLLNDDGTRADLVASTGEAGRQLLALRHNQPVGSPWVIGQVTTTGQPQIALDTADAIFAYTPDPRLPDTRSELAVPLIARDRIIGALDVHSNRTRAFSSEDVQMLISLADTVAVAIDNARLYNLAQKRAVEMAFLFQVTSAAATSPNLEEALKQAMATLRTTMGVANASIYLPDDTGQYLVRDADSNAEARSPESSGTIERSLIGWVARHNEAVIVNDLANDPRQLPGNPSTQAAIAIPLHTTGQMLGILVVESSQRGAFSDDDLRLLQALSGSLSAILQNTLLLREMQIANERLLEVDRLKTNFLAAMSHELRTPLNSIIGFSRVILKGIDGPLTETQEQDLTAIYDSGRHLLGLVNDILDQAKVEAGKMDISFQYFKMTDVINGVMSSAVGLTRDKPIRLFTDIAANLPDAYGDEFRTRQILLNLISNASKFTNEGRISVSTYPVNEYGHQYIRVDVEDTGIGIAEKDMPLLFEAFQQIDNSLTRSVAGTGMGLPLAKSLIELQHGQIEVKSQPGVGSIFSILVPTAPIDDHAADSAPQSVRTNEDKSAPIPPPKPVTEPLPDTSPTPEPPVLSGPPRVVLAVDNDREVINLYQRYLLGSGYEVIGSTHPQEIERIGTTYSPCAILLDVNMPELDGWQVLDTLKSHPVLSQIPVIMCTIETDIERGLSHGAASFLIKPVSQDQLLEALYRVDSTQPHRPHILLVDNRPDTLRDVREALEATQSYTLTQVTTGQAALDTLHTLPPVDLVILELRLPGLDGFQVLEAMRAQPSTAHIPVIALTADHVSADERAILDPHPVYIKGELDADHLLAEIAVHLLAPTEEGREG